MRGLVFHFACLFTSCKLNAEPEPVPVPGQRRYQGGRGGANGAGGNGKRGGHLSRQQTMMEIPEEPTYNPLAIMFGFGGSGAG